MTKLSLFKAEWLAQNFICYFKKAQQLINPNIISVIRFCHTKKEEMYTKRSDLSEF